mgnify:FL=1
MDPIQLLKRSSKAQQTISDHTDEVDAAARRIPAAYHRLKCSL